MGETAPLLSKTLESISLTLVQHAPGDKLGKLLAYVSLSPLAVVISYVSVILARREVAPCLMLLGQLISEILNSLLKNYIKQDRPTDFLGKGHGMPSSHSQFVSFTATYSIIYIYFELSSQNKLAKGAISLGLVLWSLIVAYSRVYLRYHSVAQVIAGLTIGFIFGILWHLIVENVIRPSPLLTWFLNTPLARYLSIRDSRAIPNIWDFEYHNTLQFQTSSSPKKNI